MNLTTQHKEFVARIRAGGTLTSEEQKEYEAYKTKRTESARKSMAKNPEKYAKTKKAYADKNKEAVAVYQAEYYTENKEHLTAQMKEYRDKEENKEAQKIRDALKYKNNKEKMDAQSRKYQAEHKEEMAEAARRRYHKNKPHILARNKNSKNARLARGECMNCNEQRIPGSKNFGLHHWFMDRINNALDRSRGIKASELVEYFENKLKAQNYRCPYTGHLLVPGENCSLDHKIPKSRMAGEENVLENLEWVSFTANIVKGMMTPEEFVAFCQLVARVAPAHLKTDNVDYFKSLPFVPGFGYLQKNKVD